MTSTTTLSWTKLADGPSSEGRDGHCSWIYQNKVYIFGGETATAQQTNELFCFDLSTSSWSTPQTTGTPPSSRTGACSCLISGDRVVIFGGADSESSTIWLNDIHILELSTLKWTSPQVSGQIPSIRDKCSCCSFGENSEFFCVYGGFGPKPQNDEQEDEHHAPTPNQDEDDEDDEDENDGVDESMKMSFTWFGDVHILKLNDMKWTKCEVNATADLPNTRCASSLCSISNTKAVLFGGRSGITGERINDTWILNLDSSSCSSTTMQISWQKLNQVGDIPEPRSFHSMVSISSSRLVVFGGLSNRLSHFSDIHLLDIGGNEGHWTSIQSNGRINPRGFHSAVIDNVAHKMLVFGGGNTYDSSINACTVLLNDFHSLDLSSLL